MAPIEDLLVEPSQEAKEGAPKADVELALARRTVRAGEVTPEASRKLLADFPV